MGELASRIRQCAEFVMVGIQNSKGRELGEVEII
jgi:hypothetical protein